MSTKSLAYKVASELFEATTPENILKLEVEFKKLHNSYITKSATKITKELMLKNGFIPGRSTVFYTYKEFCCSIKPNIPSLAFNKGVFISNVAELEEALELCGYDKIIEL